MLSPHGVFVDVQVLVGLTGAAVVADVPSRAATAEAAVAEARQLCNSVTVADGKLVFPVPRWVLMRCCWPPCTPLPMRVNTCTAMRQLVCALWGNM